MSANVCPQCHDPADAGLIFCKNCGATLRSPVSLTQSRDQSVSDIPQVRPWVRYWARMFDVYVFSIIIGIFQVMFAPRSLSRSVLATMVMGMIVLLLWVFVESSLLWWFGTTPGKSLFKIRLLLAGSRSIPFSEALVRSFRVWWRGLGAGAPVISLITLSHADDDLTRDSVTSWDREGGFVVVHEKIGPLRVGLAVICFAMFSLLSIAGTLFWFSR